MKPRTALPILFVVSVAAVFSVAGPAEVKGEDLGRIRSDGKVDFQVHVKFPPTGSDIERLEAAIRESSQMFCDATDGQMTWGSVYVTSSNLNEREADVWLMPPGAWERARNSGFLPEASSRIWLDYDGRNSFQLWAHEMGHGVLSLNDTYDEQNRYGAYSGIGPAYDGGRCSLTQDFCTEDVQCGSAETCMFGYCGDEGAPCSADADCGSATCVLDDAVATPQSHSMMGTNPPRFVSPGGAVVNAPFCAPSDSVPPPANALKACLGGERDCYAGAPVSYIDDFCKMEDLYSEFSVPSTHDLRKGTGTCPKFSAGDKLIFGPSWFSDSAPLAAGPDPTRVAAPPFIYTSSSIRPISTFLLDDKKTYVLDFVGLVDGYDANSIHRLLISVRNEADPPGLGVDRWHMLLLMKEAEFPAPFPGRTAENLRVVGNYYLDFDISAIVPGLYAPDNAAGFPLKEINGFPGKVETLTFPTFRTVDTELGPQIPPTQSIDIDFSNLVLRAGGPGLDDVRLRPEILGSNDRRQYGNCFLSKEDSFCLNGCDGKYNAVTDRWETAESERSDWEIATRTRDSKAPGTEIGSTGQFRSDEDGFSFAMLRSPGELGNEFPLVDGPDGPSGLPVCAEAAGATQVDIDEDLTNTDDIILLLDSSCSMRAEACNLGECMPRIVWARAAARAMVDLFATEGIAATSGGKRRLGIVEFDTVATVKTPRALGASAGAPTPGSNNTGFADSFPSRIGAVLDREASTCTTAMTCPSGEIPNSEFYDIIDAAVDSGHTALYAGLRRAQDTFDLAACSSTGGSPGTCFNNLAVPCTSNVDCGAARAKAVVVLSDGAPNVPDFVGTCCEEEDRELAAKLAIDEAERMRSEGIQVFAVPFGQDGSTEYFGSLTEAGGGETYGTDETTALPMVMAEVYARVTGASLLVGRTPFAVAALDPPPPGDVGGGLGQALDAAASESTHTSTGTELEDPAGGPLPRSEVFTFRVEEEASSLTVMLSAREGDPSDFDVEFLLESPDGTVYSEEDVDLVSLDQRDNVYEFIRVPLPETGDWELTISSELSNFTRDQFGYWMAWAENEAPDCWSFVSKDVLPNQLGSVEIVARPTWYGPISNARVSARVRGPTGDVTALSLSPVADEPFTYTADFSQFSGRGRYEVDVTCSVGLGAAFAEGETELEPETQAGSLGRPRSFERTSSTEFVVTGGPYAPLPPGRDCDGDGLTNEEEGLPTCPPGETCVPPEDAPDADQDGIPDGCDGDSDNDDLPDSEEDPGDSDGDGLPGPVDPDSDGDGTGDGADPDPSNPGIGSTKGQCEVSRDLLNYAGYLLALNDVSTAVARISDSFAIEFGFLGSLPAGSLGGFVLRLALLGEVAAANAATSSVGAPTAMEAARLREEARDLLAFSFFLKGLLCNAFPDLGA